MDRSSSSSSDEDDKKGTGKPETSSALNVAPGSSSTENVPSSSSADVTQSHSLTAGRMKAMTVQPTAARTYIPMAPTVPLAPLPPVVHVSPPPSYNTLPRTSKQSSTKKPIVGTSSVASSSRETLLQPASKSQGMTPATSGSNMLRISPVPTPHITVSTSFPQEEFDDQQYHRISPVKSEEKRRKAESPGQMEASEGEPSKAKREGPFGGYLYLLKREMNSLKEEIDPLQKQMEVLKELYERAEIAIQESSQGSAASPNKLVILQPFEQIMSELYVKFGKLQLDAYNNVANAVIQRLDKKVNQADLRAIVNDIKSKAAREERKALKKK